MKDGGTVERDDDVEVEYTEDGTEIGVGGTITGDWNVTWLDIVDEDVTCEDDFLVCCISICKS